MTSRAARASFSQMARQLRLVVLAIPVLGCVGPEPEYGAGATGGAGGASSTSTTGGPQACSEDSECGDLLSGRVCSDEEVCCDQRCDDDCRSCIAANTGKSEGYCHSVLEGTDPRSQCPTMNVCDGESSFPGCLGLAGATCDLPTQCLSQECEFSQCTSP